jgi:guanylate kinase
MKKIRYYKKITTDYRKKRIILAGKGGSGKDHLRNLLVEKGFKYCISFTTRPKRPTEIEGEDYFFIDENEFKEMIDKDSFIEYVNFNQWYYGTPKDQFQSSNVLIMTPSGIFKLSDEDRMQSFILFIDIDQETRRNRLSQRRDADAVERRIEADEKDFFEFSDYDAKIIDPNFTLENINELLIFPHDENKHPFRYKLPF